MRPFNELEKLAEATEEVTITKGELKSLLDFRWSDFVIGILFCIAIEFLVLLFLSIGHNAR